MSTSAVRAERAREAAPAGPSKGLSSSSAAPSSGLDRLSEGSGDGSSATGLSRAASAGLSSPRTTLSPSASITGRTAQGGSGAAAASAGASSSSSSSGGCCVSWGDRFLLREDDLLLGDMQLQFEVVSEKRWPVPDLTLALVSGLTNWFSTSRWWF